MVTFSCVIIDDEAQARAALKKDISVHCPDLSIAGSAVNVKEGKELIKKIKPDLVFLDIHLTDGIGFDILEQLEEQNFKVIFTTAYSQYAIKAIRFSALDYLLKPIDSKELKEAVHKVVKIKTSTQQEIIQNYFYNRQHQSGKKRIALSTSGGIQLIELESIIRCQADGNYTKVIFTNRNELLIAKTLKEFEDLLQVYGFERIHISHLINFEHLLSYNSKEGGRVKMRDGASIPVAQRKKNHLLNLLKSLNH